MIGSPNTTEDGFLAHVSVIKQYLSSDLSLVVCSFTGLLMICQSVARNMFLLK